MGLVRREEKQTITENVIFVSVCIVVVKAEFAMTEGQKRKEEMKVYYICEYTTKVNDASLLEFVDISTRNGISSGTQLNLLVQFYLHLRISN